MRPTANAPARTADEDAALWDAASLLLDPPASMMNPLVTDQPGTTAATGKTPRSPVTAGMDGHQSSTGPSSGDESAASTPTSAAMAAAPPASASSTVSHTAPTPLASAWLNWDNPRATVDIAANLPDGALALRRFKNRESMRRARQRQRDQLQHLRDVVAALEAQYSRLSVAASQRLENEPDRSNSSTTNDNSSNSNSSSNSEYTAAVGLAKRLGAENLLLRSTIQDQADWKLELHRVFETMGYLNEPVQFAAAPVAPLPFQLDLLNPFEAESVFGFHPITESDVKDLILENSRVVARVKNQLLADDHSTVLAVEDGGASPPPVVDVSGASRMDVFGWDVRERVEGPEMHFVFSKRFEALAVPEVMQRTWVSELQLTGMQKVKYDTIRLAPLQEVSANAYVLGRDVRSPDENPLFRSTLLRFRIETSCELPRSDPNLPPLRASGFVIGTQTLNPHANAGAALVPDVACASAGPQGDTKARLVWADLMYAIEFLTVEDPAGESGGFVLVRWAGKTNYGSEFDAYRNTADKLSSLLHWELQNVSPPVQLLSGSLGDESRTN